MKVSVDGLKETNGALVSMTAETVALVGSVAGRVYDLPAIIVKVDGRLGNVGSCATII